MVTQNAQEAFHRHKLRRASDHNARARALVALQDALGLFGVQRLAEFLVSLSLTEQGHCALALPYDKSLIAGQLGLQPESLSRAFAIGLSAASCRERKNYTTPLKIIGTLAGR